MRLATALTASVLAVTISLNVDAVDSTSGLTQQVQMEEAKQGIMIRLPLLNDAESLATPYSSQVPELTNEQTLAIFNADASSTSNGYLMDLSAQAVDRQKARDAQIQQTVHDMCPAPVAAPDTPGSDIMSALMPSLSIFQTGLLTQRNVMATPMVQPSRTAAGTQGSGPNYQTVNSINGTTANIPISAGGGNSNFTSTGTGVTR
jgi:hypothetical protein